MSGQQWTQISQKVHRSHGLIQETHIVWLEKGMGFSCSFKCEIKTYGEEEQWSETLGVKEPN